MADPDEGPRTDGDVLDRELVPDAHRLLQRLVGRAPADAMAVGRDAVVDGDVRAAARVLTQLVVGLRQPLLPDEATALGLLLADLEAEEVAFVPDPVDELPAPSLVMRPASDVTEGTGWALGPVVEADPDSLGLWCAEALPAWDAPWPAPAAFVVVETCSADGIDALDLRLHTALRDLDPTGSVHLAVIGPAGPESVVTATAQTSGTLLWARDAAAEITMAAVFPLGPPGDDGAGAAALDPADRRAVEEYLSAAEVVLRADTQADDHVTGQPACVPMDLRSDGRWVWSDATLHYLTEHDLPPDADLVAHVLAADGALPSRLDGVAYHRVVAAVTGAER